MWISYIIPTGTESKKWRSASQNWEMRNAKLCLEHDSHRRRAKTRYDAVKDVSDVMNILINDVDCNLISCKACSHYEKHLERANIARSVYMNDSHLYVAKKDETIQSVDMQKVIMLPRMPGVKRAVFTKRIVAFNMTFAPLGGWKGGKPLGIIWHETICGRNDEDVTSTYVKFVKDYKRDCRIITWWADNCSAQNKNWTLFTTFCQLVNNPSTSCGTLTKKETSVRLRRF